MNDAEKTMLKLFVKKAVVIGLCVGIAYFIEQRDRTPFED